MKYMNKAIALFLISIQIISFGSSKSTPKAGDLENHYGTDLSHNKYGPHHPHGVNLRREGVGPGVPVTPIHNYNAEINPAHVVAGNLENTAFDASKIVNAVIATPKIEIKTKFHHEAVVKTPVHLGNHVEDRVVTSFNRINGKVDSKKVSVTKPILGIKNEVKNVVHEHTSVVDVHTGKLAAGNPDVKLHGR
jgi:hypothetical protein